MRDNKNGFTLLETLIVVAIVVILAAISVPNLLETQHSARRGVIVTDLQTLTDALGAYFMLCGGYPTQLPNNNSGETGCSSSPSDTQASTIASQESSTGSAVDSASEVMGGYRFTYIPADMGDDGLYHSYTLTADPMNSGVMGGQFYFTDQTGVIRVNANAEASSSDPAFVR